VTIDNPAANTWDTESLPALRDLVTALNEERDIYALVTHRRRRQVLFRRRRPQAVCRRRPGDRREMARLLR
jgi:hypothetical protein